MKTYIFILLIPFLLGFSGLAVSQVEPEEEIIISKPEVDSANIDTFYDELSKDGEWIKVEDSEIDNDEVLEMSETVEIDEDIITGYVWRPSISITLVDWNPYYYGHWEFCRFGWIWVSDYSWGWGPYHYGRWWYSHRWGWVWSPGHRWAPSWVSWCHTRHHVGWHPISPRTHWRHHNGIIVTHPRTPKQKGITNKWTFVSKKDFTSPITKHNTIDLRKDKNLVSDAKMNFKSDELYNVGPKKSDIENNTNTKISTKKVNVTNLSGNPINDAGTKKFEKNIRTAKNNNYNGETKKSTEKNSNTSTKKKQDNSYRSGNSDNGTYKNPGTRKENNSGNTRKESGTRKDNGNTRKDNGNTRKESGTKKDNGSNKNTNTNKSGNTKKSSSNNYNWNSGSTKSSENKKSSNTYKSNDTYKSNNSNSSNNYKSSNSNSSNNYKSSNSHSSNNNSSYKSGNSNSSNHNSNSNTNKSSNNSGNNNSGNKKK